MSLSCRAEFLGSLRVNLVRPLIDKVGPKMRKQYHFWRGNEGVDAWDVDRLIELSKGLAIEEITLSEIWELDSAYWFGDEHPPTVRKVVEHFRLIEDLDPSHPIILGPDGRVMDGMHRVARALLEGRESIRAVRLTVLPNPDYRNCRPEELPY